jgi:hypothetical protein
MSTHRSCSFCHTLVDVEVDLCPCCAHQAHVPRLACQCAQCAMPPTLTVASVLHDLEEQMRQADLEGHVSPLSLQVWIGLVSAIRKTLAEA